MLSLKTYIEKFKEARVLVIGDIMLDKYEYGKVERISPEAPVPVFKFEKEKVMLGGAGNVVANLSALGCSTIFIGGVGEDLYGKKIAHLLEKLNVESHLIQIKDYLTTVKTRFIAGNNHLLRADSEVIFPDWKSSFKQFQSQVKKAIQKADVVLLSDYGKGVLTQETTPWIIQACQAAHKKVIVDPKGNDYQKYCGATLVKPNLKEFSEITGHKYFPKEKDFLQQLSQQAKLLLKTYQIQNLIVTLSEYGMFYLSDASPENHILIPTEAKEVFDVSGAGDTALAVLGAAIGVGAEYEQAIRLSNLASGIVVGKLGTATVSVDELNKALLLKEENLKNSPQRKIVSLKQAKEIVAQLKSQGKVIGFTNGCFDCCHLGHLSSFIQAKSYCDVLIVGLNSDASVKRSKGPHRPIQDEKTRSLLLAAMEFIDYIVVFDDDVPLPLVDALRPDIIAKEGYTLDKWPEGRFVQSYGGKAITLKRIDGYSTTQLVQRMKG